MESPVENPGFQIRQIENLDENVFRKIGERRWLSNHLFKKNNRTTFLRNQATKLLYKWHTKHEKL